jgi:broad specificity phosphatase PhoE
MAKILLIRHGEPEVRGVLPGRSNPGLSAAGRRQAREALASLRTDFVWSSPLRRAAETAALIPHAPIGELDALREIDMGEWTGLSWAQVEHSWSELAGRKLADWFGVTPPGGESWPAFVLRVAGAWDVIRRGSANAVVVAHQGVNAALLYLISGRDPTQFRQQYCEVISVDYD